MRGIRIDMAADRKVYGHLAIFIDISAMHFHYHFCNVVINISRLKYVI